MSARICLVTTGQPSTNPRLVKEADTLVEAGYQVHVVGAHWAEWADEQDQRLLATRRWTVTLIDWRRTHAPLLFHATRLRHRVARLVAGTPAARFLSKEAALSRIGPELRRAAASIPAEMYIAHNLGALPAAHAAAREHGARLGFDAEDLHPGQLSRLDPMRSVVEEAERALLPACDCLTAASPGIAAAYERLYGIGPLTTVLNVFPLSDRPASFRPTDVAGPLRLYWFSQTIGPARGLEETIRAMGLLGDRRIELHLRGESRDGFEQVLRTLAQDCGLAPSQIVTHGTSSPDEMVRCAAAYDVGLAVEPAANENNDIALSNKIFTYVLAGSALVMTSTTGQAALFPRLAPAAVACLPKNPESMAAALAPWLADRQALDEARRAAWALGDTVFNWERERLVFLEAVRRALATSAKAA